MRFSDYITRIQRAERETLLENKKEYYQMMQPVMAFFPSEEVSKIRTEIENIRGWYQRKDRIIWALRLYRLYLLFRIFGEIASTTTKDDEVEQKRKIVQELFDKEIKKFEKAGIERIVAVDDALKLTTEPFTKNTMHHHLSMMDEIPALQQVVFKWQTVSDLFTIMSGIEEEWKKEREAELAPTPDDYRDAELVIQFPDGFAWWNLNVESCRREGGAMGHCGNTATPKSGDRILSLRKEIVRGENTYHVPFLTFILDENGLLGEMKGRGNEKPADRYHPYIVALLKQPIIEGIKGGGHAPENNFAMKDLDPDQYEEVIRHNPDLEDLWDMFRRVGNTSEFRARLQKVLDAADLPEVYDFNPDSEDQEEVVLARWDSLLDLSNQVNWKLLKQVATVNDMDESDLSSDVETVTDLSTGLIQEILHELPGELLRRIADDLGVDVSGLNRFKATDRMAMDFHRSSYYPVMKEAAIIEKGFPIDRTSDEWKEYVQIVLYRSLVHDDGMIGLEWNSDTDEVRLTVSYDHFVSLIAASSDNDWDNETSRYVATVREQGDWFTTEIYQSNDNYREDVEYGNSEVKDLHKMFYDRVVALANGKDDSSFDSVVPQKVAWNFQTLLRRMESKTESSEFDRLLEEIKRKAGL